MLYKISNLFCNFLNIQIAIFKKYFNGPACAHLGGIQSELVSSPCPPPPKVKGEEDDVPELVLSPRFSKNWWVVSEVLIVGSSGCG